MSDIDTLVGWMLTGVAAVVGTLAACVGMLWKINESKNSQAIEGLQKQLTALQARYDALFEECQTYIRERDDLRLRLAVLEKRVNGTEHQH